MNSTALEQAIKDCGLPGRLVEVDKNLVTMDLLNDRTERLERHQFGLSEFCDLLLDWRQRLQSRGVGVSTAGSASTPRRRAARTTARRRQADPDLSVENAA
jgi:hypothetical protein